jgi:hypothetical protein
VTLRRRCRDGAGVVITCRRRHGSWTPTILAAPPNGKVGHQSTRGVSVYLRILVAWLAVIGALPQLLVNAAAPPKPANPNKGSELYVIMKARLYEVDEAFHNKLAKARWRSQAHLEELETKPQDNTLFDLLKKQKPSLVGKEINVDPGKEGLLLRSTKPNNRLPTPDQLRQGKKTPQTIDEGFTLRAQVHVTADRRFVRVKFVEKSQEIEGIEKVEIVVDDKGNEAIGEIVFVKEASFSRTRYVHDGGSILLSIHYRPSAVRKKDRWLVAEITPRIYVEEEERARREQPPGG